MSWDIQTFYFFNNFANQNTISNAIIIFFAGDFQYYFITLFLLAVIFSKYSRKIKIDLILIPALSAIIARLGFAEIIRYLCHRPRPFEILNANQLIELNNSFLNQYSFPSGHASFLFAFSTAIYFHNKKWGIIFFINSAIICVARIMAGVHYPSDIIAGAAVGVISAFLIKYLFDFISTKKALNISKRL